LPFIGSRAAAGRFDPALLVLKDADGVSLESAIRAFGLDPSRIVDAAIDNEVFGFFEIHIEQGPVLEAEELHVAVVTSIVGQTRLRLQFAGHANHAGTTPMNLRRDALAGAAEFISAVEAQAKQTEGLVATVGRLEVEPNAGNVIPGKVRVACDVRHPKDAIRNETVGALLEQAQSIANRRSLQLECARQMDQPAVPMDERLTAFLADATETAGLPLKFMPSGAGHDAMVMASRVPAVMLFLRSPGGISHHPNETVLEEDVDAALRVGREFLRRLATEAGDRNF
jgi:allantoate deiminase